LFRAVSETAQLMTNVFKVKVKLSHVLNYASREDVWGNGGGGIAVHILNLGTRWR
jgi:hypothetical protein